MPTILHYSNGTLRLRKIYRDDMTVDDMLVNIPPLPGVSTIEYPPGGFPTPEEAQAFINTETGGEPENDRYVLVNPAGIVTGAIIIDPAIDPIPPGLTAHQHATATHGDRLLTGGDFSRSDEELDRLIQTAEGRRDRLDLIDDPPLTPAELARQRAAFNQEIAGYRQEKARN